jgi:hypothetical protein
MTPLRTFRPTCWLAPLLALAAAFLVAACATTASAPRVDPSDLTAAGFTTLVAQDNVQRDWVQSLPPGQIRPMQRNGKKFFIYPDAPRSQVYVGGPQQYEAFLRAHPDYRPASSQTEANLAAYAKQSDAMGAASAREQSDPWFGMSWNEIMGW